MYTTHKNEIVNGDCTPEAIQRPSDLPISSEVTWVLLIGWMVIFAVGLALIQWAKLPLVGAMVIGIPTFIGMIIKPSFALCIFLMVLPTGGGIAYEKIFSLDKGVGIALAVSFMFNIMLSRPSLKIRNKALWIFMIYTLWILFASLASPHLQLEILRFLTQLQLLALILIAYWILTTNGYSAFKWVLRSYIIGATGMFILSYLTGAALISQSESTQGRSTTTLGGTIDANALGVIYAIAVILAIYLIMADKKASLRLLYILSSAILLIAIFITGSRTALLALGISVFSPLLFLSQIFKKPKLAMALIVLGVCVFFSITLLFSKHLLEEQVQSRITDVEYAKETLGYRMHLNKRAISVAITRPMGASYYGWFHVAGMKHWPHNDLFLALGVYGIPGGFLLILFWIAIIWTIRRMPFSVEKLLARSMMIFLLLTGLTIGQLFHKHYWVFMVVIIVCDRFCGESEPVDKNVVLYDDSQYASN